jgi:hypothetical protein
MEKAITADYGVKRLGTNIVANMKNSKTPTPAIRSFLTGVDELTGFYRTNGKALTKENENKAIATNKKPASKDNSPGILSYLVGLAASVAAAFGYRSNLRSQMSNVATADTALDYVDEEGLNMTVATDEYDHTDIQRTPRAKVLLAKPKKMWLRNLIMTRIVVVAVANGSHQTPNCILKEANPMRTCKILIMTLLVLAKLGAYPHRG